MTSIHNIYPINRSSGSSTSTSGSSGTSKAISSNAAGISLRGRTESPSAQRKYHHATGQVANMINRLTTSSNAPPPTNIMNTQRSIKQSAQMSTTPTSNNTNFDYYTNSGNISNGYLSKPTSLMPSTRRTSFKSLITDEPDESITSKTVNRIKSNQQQQLINTKNEIETRTLANKATKFTSYYSTSQPSAVSSTTTIKDMSDNLHLLDLNKAFHANSMNTYVSNASSNTSSPTILAPSINDSIYSSNNNSMRVNQPSSSSSTRQANLKISMGIRAGSASSTTNENDYSRSQNGIVTSEFYAPTAANIITSSSSSSSYKSTSNQMPSSSSLSSSSSNTKYNESRSELNPYEIKGMVGLKNLGNTCFMNSILQCLSNTKCLLEYCLKNTYQDDINTTLSVMKGSLFNSYASLIKTMWRSESIVSPQDFKSQIARFAPRFVGYAQQDAEEFLTYLLKGLHEDVNLVTKKPSPFRFDEKAWDRMNDLEKSEEHWRMNLRTDNSRITDMFVGQLKSTLKCTKCDYKSPTFELFWHLAVPIPNKNSSIKLDDCLKLFMSEEILDGENKPVCSRCNEKRRCTKRYTIEKLPKILVIHLKRFSKIRFNNKINLNVDYPIESLDMSKYLSDNIDLSTNRNCIYDLYGISLHSGTESSGHYVAYCRHPYKKRWYCYNDSQVREISYNALQDSDAYILFYQLRNS